MAVRKFILVVGQSNALEVGDAQSWEDLHPYVSVRSPQSDLTEVPQFSSGSEAQLVNLPYTFNGGQQTKEDGDGTAADSWQYANAVGKTSEAIRYLTFYDPSPAYYNGVFVEGQYPGSGCLLSGSTSTSLTTSVRWQVNPSGIKITRRRTNTVHTINTTGSGTSIVGITPPMVPAPQAGDALSGELLQFDVERSGSARRDRAVGRYPGCSL